VGRLVDAQEFEDLSVPRERFDAAVLDELKRDAGSAVADDGRRVVVRHLYTERRLRPLDLYLRECGRDAAEAAIVEYGNAIKDLACANIFPGDLLLKNFGVSRHGRVIFYDYDELCLVTECNFRDLPAARDDEDEMRPEPWFYVGPADVFPAQWLEFLGIKGPLREEFLRHHAELLTAGYWRRLRVSHEAERHLEIVPYTARRAAVAPA
jgi:isocitrate dehydrogenase kinase/phosphatase